jgi:pyruvate/2-oxoglutarate dehydrogenase complex dihydrolipoamide acyltransferase (E2) component
LLSFGVFLTGYLGIAITMWPYIVPFEITFRQAATAPESQSLLLVGTVIMLPLILAYVGYSGEKHLTNMKALTDKQRQWLRFAALWCGGLSAVKDSGIKITPLVFIMKAAAKALEAFPSFNSSLSEDGESLILKKYVNVGIAVDTPNGLVVPVVKDVNKKGIYELSEELMVVSKKARAGKLTTADMQGGCFTISSLGGIGGTAFTPIVNAPEVGILGVSKSELKPVWNGKEFEPRLLLPLSLSYDHRVIDGAEGARFITYLISFLSDIRQLVM